MANPEHLAVLEQGVEVWNRWRARNPGIFPDLFGADFGEANLNGANFGETNLIEANLNGAYLERANLGEAYLERTNLRGANLEGARLREAYLERAKLGGANLTNANLDRANLSRANLGGANLERAKLRGANLTNANLSRANLGGAYLRGTNLRGANLETADLSAADLSRTNSESANLRRCDMIDSKLDSAMITGAILWESKRSGWSIKGVICEYAYFDREGKEKTKFEPGEFEKLYSEQTKIVLHYEDGLTQFEVTTLPALIKFIENKHAGSSLRLRTIGEDVGGASVTVAVDELGEADLSILQEDFEKSKERIRDEVKRDAEMEIKSLEDQVKLLTGIIDRNMGDTFNINKLIGVGKAESSTVNQNINNNDLDAISKLFSDILAARPEIEKVIPTEKADELNAAFEVIEEQSKAPEKNWEKVKKGAQDIKNVLDGVGDTAGKWMPIIEKLSDLL